MVTIDVLLAAFEGEAYLPRQLDSLRRQFRQGFELRVLMQDDGSADATPALLRDVTAQDPRFQLGAEQGRHFGAADNFFSLMRQSDAPYAALCDQDDVWAPDRLARCFAAMQEAEQRYGADTPLLIHSDSSLVDAKGELLHASFFLHQGWSGKAVTLPALLVQNNVTGCTTLINASLRSLLTAHVQPGQVRYHDWLMAQTAAAFGHVVFVDVPLVYYRQHGGNAVGASSGSQAERAVKALKHIDSIRERIALTYRTAQLLRQLYGSDLPPDAAACIDCYLGAEHMPKWKRLMVLLHGGYLMQSPLTRAGQLLFG